MKKLLILTLCSSLCACYYVVPEQDPYVETAYTVPATTYYGMADNVVYDAAQTTTYVTPAASSSVVYIEQSAPDVVYVNSGPDIVYYDNPLLPPYSYEPYRPPYPRPTYTPSHPHRVGTPPRKHIARPAHEPVRHHKPQKLVHDNPAPQHGHRKSAEGRP